MFFEDWSSIFRIVVLGVTSYALLIVALRIAGKRTLSKWNAFDFVVTIAFGSILATVIISKDIELAEGIVGLTLLIGLQFVLTWTAARWRWVDRLIKAEPAMLFHQGRFLRDSMRAERVSEEEVRSAIRGAGIAELEAVEAVVLETDGSLSVVKKPTNGVATSLADVRKPNDP